MSVEATVRKGLGWVKGFTWSPELQKRSDDHLGSLQSVPDEGGTEVAPWITDQGIRESCTAEMGIRWIYVLTGGRIKCSSWVPWWAARVLDAPGMPLQNVGVSLDGFVQALKMDGACEIERVVNGERIELCPANYPVENTEVDPYAGVPPHIARDEAQAFNLDVVQIFAYGERAIAGTVAVLDRGKPAGTVVWADSEYRNPPIVGGEAIVGPGTQTGGRHAIPVLNYRKRASGIYEFKTWGSWDETHGVMGEVWIHQDRIANAPFNGFAESAS